MAYLEGIFVKAPYRRMGTARRLLSMCWEWSIGKGCSELASDCELNNDGGLGFHLNYGFSEINRIIKYSVKRDELRLNEDLLAMRQSPI